MKMTTGRMDSRAGVGHFHFVAAGRIWSSHAGLSENRHEARDQPCRSDGYSLFVVAGQSGPAMLVYPKIATKHGANHAGVTDFHCLLWLGNLVQPCWFIPGR